MPSRFRWYKIHLSFSKFNHIYLRTLYFINHYFLVWWIHPFIYVVTPIKKTKRNLTSAQIRTLSWSQHLSKCFFTGIQLKKVYFYTKHIILCLYLNRRGKRTALKNNRANQLPFHYSNNDIYHLVILIFYVPPFTKYWHHSISINLALLLPFSFISFTKFGVFSF